MKLTIPKRKKQEDNSRQRQLFFILPFAVLSLLLLLPSALATSACHSSAQKCRCADGTYEYPGTIEKLSERRNNPASCCYSPPSASTGTPTPRYAQLQPVYSLEYYSARYAAQEAAKEATASYENKNKIVPLTPIMVNGQYVKKDLLKNIVPLTPIDLNMLKAHQAGINITEVQIPLTQQQMAQFFVESTSYVYHLFI